ncbi:M28 family metallopeptidase [Paraliomyxa miuraensis]|uniref:M28 family metallopeptidase n=1 Tax=Paraliomyxa miuraensis TaxID=376150 RepID=UPI002255ACFE|nr:M28 family peptidase [Paraliomyxa miuraensis]MCX4243796.1 M28 family peptidase [Paraliomyxa miuraensis]
MRIRAPLACTLLCGCMLDARVITEADTDGSASGGGESNGSASASSAGAEPGGPEGCATGSATALARCVDADAIAADVSFIADVRTPGSPHWLAVQELCADRLTMLGFDVELQEFTGGTNVIGRLPGAAASNEVVLVGAHYDHIDGCLGADDNGTGVAGVLELARVLASAPSRPRTLAVACWDQEELGLLGSIAWVGTGQVPGETVVVYFNYDMIGMASDSPGSQAIPPGFDGLFPTQYAQVEANGFRGDFVLVAADELALAPAQAYEAHAATLGLPSISAVLDAEAKNSALFIDLRRSDHAPFWAVDIPAIFLTDTGELRNERYHCWGGQDDVASLDFGFSGQVVAATVGAAAESLGVGR